jgi:hypothetical protein
MKKVIYIFIAIGILFVNGAEAKINHETFRNINKSSNIWHYAPDCQNIDSIIFELSIGNRLEFSLRKSCNPHLNLRIFLKEMKENSQLVAEAELPGKIFSMKLTLNHSKALDNAVTLTYMVKRS